MECRLETITPKRAQELLKINTYNRPLRQSHITKLSEAMKRGEWKLTGDTIKMNGSVLLDGQHRLWAVVKSGIAIQTYVARGVQKEAYSCIDQGTARSYSDHLGREGEKYYSNIAAAIRFIHCYQSNNFRSNAPSNQQGDAILSQFPQLRESVQFVFPLRQRGMIGVGPATAMHCLMGLKNKSASDAFWNGVLSGEGLTKSSPEYQIRQKMLDNMSGNTRFQSVAIYAMCIKAWNAKRSGKPLKVLRWADNEEFPSIQ